MRTRTRLKPTRRTLLRLYASLLARFGHAHWWPAETPFEVCVGAVLTQNTAWTNVERALHALRGAGLLEPQAMAGLSADELAPLIRCAGTYNVKARRLRALLDFLMRECDGDLTRLRTRAPAELRARLLAVNGIGPETADAILLYAVGLPVFVVDAYTRRVFARLGLVGARDAYEQVQRFFMQRLPRDAALFNDYHAQIVRLAKAACRARPRCEHCPLAETCPRLGVPVGPAPRPASRRKEKP